MNAVDYQLIVYLNQFSQSSRDFDICIEFLSGNHLLKGGVLASTIWFGWFSIKKNHLNGRIHILLTLFSCAVAMLFARLLAKLLPFRLRPLHSDDLQLLLPYGMEPMALEALSSFPSDHAVLFFALSSGLFFVSKKIGLFAILYSVFFIAFPRVYLGLHYPTDIIGGAVIGILVTALGNYCLAGNSLVAKIENLSEANPNIFYPMFFLITYQIADMFDSSRAIVSFMLTYL